MDQGMRSFGSVVMGAFVSLFGAALGLALSIALTGITFDRLLLAPKAAAGKIRDHSVSL